MRERKGISLAAITEATKIPSYLFEGLERNDLRRWPKGLFRRSFFRDYVRTLGLPVDDTCADFAQVFADDEVVAAPEPPVEPAAPAVSGFWKRCVEVFSEAFKGADPGTEEVEAQEAPAWVTDARRVGPAAPRIRVRIKVPR